MYTVSFIVDATSALQSDVNKLSELYKSSQLEGIHCEYILYCNAATKLTAGSGVTFISTQTSSINPFYKAIASSCGERLVFTTLKNVLSDDDNLIAKQASELKDGHIFVTTLNQNKVLRILGVRYFADVPYIIASKSFASSHAKLLLQPKKAVLLADKLLALQFIQNAPIHLPDVLIKKMVFLRPYYRIAKQSYVNLRNRIISSYKHWRDERLSRNVPPVRYSNDMPVFIICRDRLEPLKKLVKWCEDEGLTRLIFIDNASSYPPLLKYLSITKYEVIYLRANVGHTSPWASGAVQIYANNHPFIVTDPDVIPIDESHGAVKFFCEILTRHPERRKAGFGLKIDDLPDYYALKSHVIAWEKQFWISKIKGENDVYDAEIDTTFAVYRQGSPYILGPGARTGGKYVARHEPWYINSSKISDEIQYYRNHADKKIGSWGATKDELSETYAEKMMQTTLEDRPDTNNN